MMNLNLILTKMNRLRFFVIILLSALLLQCASQNPKIVLLEERSNRLTPAHSLSYSSTFVIENYCESNRCANRIDKLVLKHYKKTNYSKHVIGLYKESETVNLKNFKEFPELAKKGIWTIMF